MILFLVKFQLLLITFASIVGDAKPILENLDLQTEIECKNTQEIYFNHQTFCLDQCITKSEHKDTNGYTLIQSIKTNDQIEYENYCFKSIKSQSQQHSTSSRTVQVYYKNNITFLNFNSILFNSQSTTTSATHFKYSTTTSSSLMPSLEELRQQSNKMLHVFIFEFSSISGDVFIDFKLLNKIVLSSINLNTNLIINLVARQFITFRLLNLNYNNEYFTKLTILLNGECSLDIIESNKNQPNRLEIEVFNSPEFKKTVKYEWLSFLKTKFNLNLANNINYNYVEHLSMFCHVSHIRLDLTNMLLINSNNNRARNIPMSLTLVEMEKIEFVEHLEQIDFDYDLNLINKCSVNENDKESFGMDREIHLNHIDGFSKFNLNEENSVYLFEITEEIIANSNEEINQENNYLRLFVKECDNRILYNIVLFVLPKTQINDLNRYFPNKKIIFDDSNCNFNISSNILVYDLLNQKIQTNEIKIDTGEDQNRDEKWNNLIKIKVAQLFNVKVFYFLKVNPKANDIELRFSNVLMKEMAPNKFLNKLQQNIFIESNQDQINNISTNKQLQSDYSIKFVLSEADLNNYFKERFLDLQVWIPKDENEDADQASHNADHSALFSSSNQHNFFFITLKSCRVIYLYKELKYLPETNILFFNSKIYDYIDENHWLYDSSNLKLNQNQRSNDCYYFDKMANMFYLTFGFSSDYDNHVQTIYFNLKQLLLNSNKVSNINPSQIQKAPNQQLTYIETLREKSSNQYFATVIDQSLSSNCQVETKNQNETISNVENIIDSSESSTMTNSIEFKTFIKLNSLDSLISWRLENCWLSENECLTSEKNEELDSSQQQLSSTTNVKEIPNEEEVIIDENNYDYYYDENEKYDDNENLDEDIAGHSITNFNNSVKDTIFNNDYFKENLAAASELIGKRGRILEISPNDHDIKMRINHHKTYINLNKQTNTYNIYLNLTVRVNNLLTLQNKTYLVCSLKPYLFCSHFHQQQNHERNLNQILKKNYGRQQNINGAFNFKENNTCDNNLRASKYFEKNAEVLKYKSRSVFLAMYDPKSPQQSLKYFSFSSSSNKNNVMFKKCSPSSGALSSSQLHPALPNYQSNLGTSNEFEFKAINKTKNEDDRESSFNQTKPGYDKNKYNMTLLKWISHNKLTIILLSVFIIFLIICLFVLKKLLNNYYNCPNFMSLKSNSNIKRSNGNTNVAKSVNRTDQVLSNKKHLHNKNSMNGIHFSLNEEQQLKLLNKTNCENKSNKQNDESLEVVYLSNNHHYPKNHNNLNNNKNINSTTET